MKFVIIAILMTLYGVSNGQKTKSIDIARTNTIVIKGVLYYDDKNNPLDTSYLILGQDSRYQQLISFITIYKGGINDMYELLKYSQKFYTLEEDGTSENHNGHHLWIIKIMGSKILYIDELDGNGHTAFNGITLKKLISRLEEWAIASKVSLK